ncbi:MAG: flagellar biosynthesis anti-sigma factor FlgM [Labilithrix sp.]|nr:flagellar biosynthesis anti-sigma factor FlgM [Labilithrix sp.]
MRIHDAYTKLDRAAIAARAGNAKAADKGVTDAGGAGSAEGATRVNVSARARDLSAEASSRSAKVEALQARMKRGDLRVDADAIAARLLEGAGT